MFSIRSISLFLLLYNSSKYFLRSLFLPLR
jgi:hypothetical protein